MSTIIDPKATMTNLRKGLISEISSFFPFEGKKHRLVVDNIRAEDNKNIDDIPSQRKAKMGNRTWSTKIHGDVSLIDIETGAILDKKDNYKIANIPQITNRFSFIINGNEYQVDNQWRLKSGVYAREKANGEIESQFNLIKGRTFKMSFEPKKQVFLMSYGTTNVKMLPVLRALGMSDESIEKSWGKAVFASNVKAARKGELLKLAKALDRRATPATDLEAALIIKKAYADTELRADTTKATLGKAFTSITAEALTSSSTKLLAIHRGTDEVDNRDALKFKELWSVDDFIPERIKNSQRAITRKMRNNIDRRDELKSILTSDVFNVPIKSFFTTTSLSQQSSQVNPLNMVGGHLKTTLMGTGGIQSAQAITDEAKEIDPSHLGFLDPVHTPEGEKTGVALHLNLGVRKNGHEAEIRVWDVKAKKFSWKSPVDLSGKNMAFPDEYSWAGKPGSKKPTALSRQITVSNPDGPPKIVKEDEVDFILQSAKGMFSLTANMVPFLSSDQGGRVNMATRHLEQAISLKNREAPLVQTLASDRGSKTWEGLMGGLAAHKAPRDLDYGKGGATVSKVTDDYVELTDASGEKRKVFIYNNFPLNDKKAFIHSTPIVKLGDKVNADDTVADTNFSRDGILSLGTNLTIAYLPYKGYVFEDGIVVSESAAEKLESEHLNRSKVYVDKNMTLGLSLFRRNFPGMVTDENADKLDENGVMRIGQKVHPGDTIITMLQKSDPSKEQLLMRGIHKSLAKPFRDRSVKWDSDITGTVTDVVNNGREWTVYIKTSEKADIGDKLCFTNKHLIAVRA